MNKTKENKTTQNHNTNKQININKILNHKTKNEL